MFDREYLTQPRSSASSLFPFERIEPCLRRDLALVPWYHKPVSLESRYGVATGWDIAWSERTGGDWLAKVTGVLDRQKMTKRIVDIERWQAVAFDDQIDLIQTSWGSYRDDVVVVEDDFAQRVWVQRLKSTTRCPVIGHSASGKKDLEQGVPRMLIDFDRKVYEIPWQPGSWKHDRVEALLGELEAFGWEDDKLQGVGEHDDLVMAFYHVDYGLEMLKPRLRVRRTQRREQAGVEI